MSVGFIAALGELSGVPEGVVSIGAPAFQKPRPVAVDVALSTDFPRIRRTELVVEYSSCGVVDDSGRRTTKWRWLRCLCTKVLSSSPESVAALVRECFSLTCSGVPRTTSALLSGIAS
jgi:hypothetical protein